MTTELAKHDLHIERDVAVLPTAFKAFKGKAENPAIGLIAEPDALPELGHACGTISSQPTLSEPPRIYPNFSMMLEGELLFLRLQMREVNRCGQKSIGSRISGQRQDHYG